MQNCNFQSLDLKNFDLGNFGIWMSELDFLVYLIRICEIEFNFDLLLGSQNLALNLDIKL